MNMKEVIRKNSWCSLFSAATIGIEKEGQRVLFNGNITTTPHLRNVGNRQGHPYIQTDFAETQIELITPPKITENEVYRYLSAIHEVVLRKMASDEYIWPLSIPAVLPPEEQIKVAQFDNLEDVEYREYLVSVYGKYKQMVSGIHYNFGFSQKFINDLKNEKNISEVELRNNLYMKLARQFIRYQWLLVYLYGVSPLAPKEYFGKQEPLTTPVRSLRVSKYGYVNEEHIQVSYNSIEKYSQDIRHYVDTNQLIAEKEFYSSVRFRGAKSVLDLPKKGISYLEFRLFDINPFSPYGMAEEDIRFVHLFALYLVWRDEENYKTSVEIGKQYTEEVALEHPLAETKYKEEGIELLEDMLAMLNECHYSEEDKILIKTKLEQMLDPEKTIGGRFWLEYCQTENMAELGMKYAKKYKENALEKYYNLSAFKNMELSTQALISDAIASGISVDIIDEDDQFLKLSYKNHIEYVKNGNMTSHDNYISPLMMENKVVTKKVLEEQNFRVPQGYQYRDVETALREFPNIKGKAIVIKPKSTNFGLGITIFKNGVQNIEDYEKAITIALKEDKEVLIEEFIDGTEYRFFVLNGDTKAVLKRVPANVVGDGEKTISQLVSEKNNNPLRGDGLSSPLKKIVIGDIELLQLKEQGYSVDTVLEPGEIAYLRENSNISTGGDSVDMTDEMHDSYKKIAEEVAKAMFAKVCGVDIMIKDIESEATGTNHGIIEANFNPMMMMHIFPSKGKSRRITENILEMLFPEKNN